MSDELSEDQEAANGHTSGRAGRTGRTAVGVLVVLLAAVVALGVQGGLPHWVSGSRATGTSAAPPPLLRRCRR